MAQVLVYYPWIYLKSGIERTIVEVARRSRHDIAIHTSRFEPEATYPELSSLGVVEHDPVSVRRSHVEVAKAAAKLLRLDFSGVDHDVLVICCDGLGPLVLFRNDSRPSINLCFTPLRAVYDRDYRVRMLEGSATKRMLHTVAEPLFRRLDRRAWSRFDAVICNSRTTRDRVVYGGLYPEDRVTVAYPGIDGSRIAEGPRSERFFLLAGRIMWTKNIELAIEAFGAFTRDHPDWRLVIAGMVDRKSRPYHDRLVELARGKGDISFETDVSDARMRALYETTSALLLASFNEDQGLTPLEAMACGKPTIAVNRGGPRETVLDGETGYLVEPEVGAYAEAMRRIAADPDHARAMGRRGLDHVQAFTWDRFMTVFDDEVDRLAAAGDNRRA